MLKIKLTRNLRRSILRGHPWVYKEAIAQPPKVESAQLVSVLDLKGEELGWAMYDPHGPLSLRMVSLEKKPPNAAFFEQQLLRAAQLRRDLNLTDTTAYRLINGEGDLLPGLVCDIYGSTSLTTSGSTAVVQFDGRGPSEFYNKDQIAGWISKATGVKSVVEKFRRNTEGGLSLLAGSPTASVIEVTENGVKFKVDIEHGQKTGFFLDQRDNRQYVRAISRGKSVLNLFSYTGGFSVYAGLGGATRVASLDVAEGAVRSAEANWALNGLPPGQHEGLAVDVFDYLTNATEKWDHVIVDPPSMGHSEEQKERAVKKYTDLFAASVKLVKTGGQLSLCSCSSHISFEDFFEIIREAMSQARRRGQILRVSGQGPDHPFLHSSHEQRYLKFVHLVLV
ncbi:class I SAM-dependent rRNA methyltransferase [Turneriella parva]|uniref:SAM-dependent methyltransferase n=1 Tax=Turneriella parva (strain ATCC BAA-1111 / DSM 21527 / NCTC 11395 / H) TaxID=869212 RepID=I4B2K1_TURPD|nr:class I SAM-dependent rRNA methyltransferase [Turneriella parva]AFM11508.1 SAM-dependent methyltransferase [Turneriella parva DSM 21527]